MRTSTLSLLFGLLLAGSACAAEPAQPASKDYAGRYALTDGRILTVEQADGTLTATIALRSASINPRFNGAREVVLKPDGMGGFMSTSTPLRISFSQDARGDIAQVRVDEHAAPMVALARR